MQNKFYVIVSVPMIERDFELYIPINKKVGTVKNLIIKMITEQSEQTFLSENNTVLYEKSTGDRILEEVFVKDSGIQDGSQLILEG